MSPAGFIKNLKISPKGLMIIGASMMVSFIVMEFLIILGVIPNRSFALHLIGYAVSTGGFFMAIIGFVSDYKEKGQK